MFTGIVTEVGRVVSILPNQLTVGAEQILKNVELGASIAVNGVCLTVTNFTAGEFTVGLSPETIRRTNLSQLKVGDPVNLERALGLGGELGGHLVQGHIDGTGKIIGISPEGDGVSISIEAPPEIMHYLVEKGFIAMEGISLTITSRNENNFQLSIIKYTYNHTNLKTHKAGDPVNLEIDIMAKYVEQYMRSQQRSNITMDFLRENGF